MIIVGIDPGTATTGFGVIKKTNKELVCLDYGVIKTKAGQDSEKRLRKIYLDLRKILKKNNPDCLGVENIYFFKNLKTGLPVSEAKGVIMLAAAQKKIPLKQLTPLEVKMGICGYGKASKKQVQRMVKKTLNLKKLPKPNDAADALAVAICSSRLVGLDRGNR